jgi:hypothetical protein
MGKGTDQTMAPEKQAAYAFVAVRDRMYPGYTACGGKNVRRFAK